MEILVVFITIKCKIKDYESNKKKKQNIKLIFL